MGNEKTIECVETGERFASIAEAARVKGCSAANISKALRNGGVAAGGRWRYTREARRAMYFDHRGAVCYTCCRCGPMADSSKVDWCATCPVNRIDLSRLP